MKTKPRGEVAKVYFMVGDEPQKEPSADAGSILWKFADGAEVKLALAAIPVSMLRCAALFGLKTKLRNSYADAPAAREAKASLERTLATLLEGNWNSGERGPSYALLPDALAIVLGVSRDIAAAKIAQVEGEDDKAYRARLAKIASDSRVAKALIDLRPKGEALDLEALMAA